MNKAFLFAVVLCAACSSKKSDTKPVVGAKAIDDGKTCPIPKTKDVTVHERFAVGVVPDYALPDMAADHGNICHDEFKPSDVVKGEGTNQKIVAEGTFEGTCKEAPSKRIYEAVKPAKVGIEVNGLAGMDLGKLGLDEPVALDSATPDKMSSINVVLLDRCGERLSHGAGAGPTTWTPGEGCDKVAKLVPWTTTGPADPTAGAMQVQAIGAGTCTITASLAGAKGDVKVTVK